MLLPLRSGYPRSTLPFNITLETILNTMVSEKETKTYRLETDILFPDYMIISAENHKESTKIYTRSNKEVSKFAGYKINIEKSIVCKQ